MSELNRNISKFWEIETIPERHIFSAEENRCEQHFHATAQRDTSGRFVVSLPFKENVNSLGASYDQALKRFYSLEKRLNKNPPLKQEYGEFIKEYLELGHMRKAKLYNYSTEPHFYLPHHAIVKENSITTRLRVVFDGSAKTSSGVSLNDTLMVGPKLQQDLFDIVCRFRLYAYVITADVAKMYRQVRINEQCMPFQRILWRMSDKSDVEIFELTTVTYGTASASYLATKVLQQLAMAKQDAQPFGAEIILRDFYVDDLLTGAQTIDQANKIIAEVTEILSQGKLELRKWASNKPELLQNIPETCCGNTILDLDKSDNISTLGLQWNATMDTLQYALSDVLDCLLSPFTVRAKILMQDIWKLEINWDESLPLSIETTWLSYVEEMKDLNNITIPRHVFPMQQPEHFELHGFSDASEKAYGACVYVRALNKFGDISCNLLCAKSRIAPIKTMTLPRLELSGALLLARLMQRLTRYLSLQFRKTCYWTDSSIVLSWLKSPKTFKTFVANRIAEIQELTNVADWHHIGTKENPADLLSRGTTSSTLMHTKLWWHGPKFLQCSTSNWPDSEFALTENLPEYYLMGDLPQHRLTPGKAFENIGVDYFGPVHIRDSMKRKHNLIKAYGAVFVCFATKAVHVELVGNLSTEAFLAALKRFVARRGSISNIYSDNGTQFIGANTELKKLLKQLQTQTQTEQVKAYMAHNGIRWHFIPPRSPHFGGLWEAAVKSVKTHLTKIIGNASLNYEEMSSLLVQIEERVPKPTSTKE
ncbi:hypothetical protein Trydic_g3631 [Trypoxylus dichotomus]